LQSKVSPFQFFEHLSGDELEVPSVAVPAEVLVDADDVHELGGLIHIHVLEPSGFLLTGRVTILGEVNFLQRAI
jgi:hypothetical protein